MSINASTGHPTGDTTSAGPLSVALVSRTSYHAMGGTAAYIRCLGEALQRRGHTVRSVARFLRKEPPVTRYEAVDTSTPAEIEAETAKSASGISTDLIAPAGLTRATLSRLATLLSRPATQNMGISLFNRAYSDSLSHALPPDVDVIHYTGNGWEMSGFTALAEARRRGIPLTIMPFVHPEVWGDSPLDVLLYNQADAVYTCSAYEADHLISRGVRPGVLHRTGLGPASSPAGDGLRFRALYGLGDRPLILFIARKDRYKGYHALCEAMETIRRAVPRACLVAAGPDTEPPYPAVADGALLDLGTLGWNPVDAQTKADALDACDVFCMPSTAEAFGIVYVEAWAAGKPVIGGLAPAVRELISEGEDGYCVSQEPAEIAAVVIRLLQDTAMRERLGSRGRAVQESRYHWDRIAENHEQLFRTLRQNKRTTDIK